MSSSLFRELAELATKTRHDLHGSGKNIVEKLTVVVGYGHMAESHPELEGVLQQHLEQFMDLTCSHGYPELCRSAGRILASMKEGKISRDAA